jgi:hypothetical protein
LNFYVFPSGVKTDLLCTFRLELFINDIQAGGWLDGFCGRQRMLHIAIDPDLDVIT